MSGNPADSITSLSISMRADRAPHFLLVLTATGQVKRMGYRDLNRVEESIAAGEVAGVFDDVVAAIPPGLLERAGTYEDPGMDGVRCQWRLDFETEMGLRRFDISYSSGSAGLPKAIGALVAKAEKATESWYAAHLETASEEAASGPEADEAGPAPYGHPMATTAPGVAGGPAPTEPAAPLPEAQSLPAQSLWADGGIRNYLSFEGRIGRMDYLMMYCVPLAALGFAGAFADGLVGFGAEAIGPMGALASLITIWPGFAGFAKRLHDMNLSLWVFPGAMLAMTLTVAVGVAVGSPIGLIPAALVGLGVIGLSLATYVWPGTKGPNRFGPEPVASVN